MIIDEFKKRVNLIPEQQWIALGSSTNRRSTRARFWRTPKHAAIQEVFEDLQVFGMFCRWIENIGYEEACKFRRKKKTNLRRISAISEEIIDFEESEDFSEEKTTSRGRNGVDESDITDDDDTLEEEFLHTKTYYYNEPNDEYIIHLPSKKHPFVMRGELWRSICDAYSNWDGQPLTINEMCRRFGMSRRTMVELLRSAGITHDSSPWSDEKLKREEEDSLVSDLIRKKEERVLLKAQQQEYRRVKRDAEKFRRFKAFALNISAIFTETHAPVRDLKYRAEDLDSFSVIISPTDFHWGKHASPYMGEEYNRDVARQRLFTTTQNVLDRVLSRGQPEKIYLAVGGDGLHIDNQAKTTTRGTPQDCDGSASEIASTYVKLCVDYAEMVSEYAPVELFVVPGNHDFYTSAILREALHAWFRNDANVNIYQTLSPRQTFLYGKSLITFMHGDTGPVKDYPSIIAGESADLWGRSSWRFIFTGHYHTERELPNFGDITVYRMPSLASNDEYHFLKGYKSRKALIGYVIDKSRGVIAQEICPI